MALTGIPGLDAALNAIRQGSLDGATNEDGTIRQTYKDLPLDREFRGVIDSAEYKTSQNGHPGIRYVIQIVDDAEYGDNKVWEGLYFTGSEFQGQRLAVLLSAAQATADTIEEAANKIVGGKIVFALQEGTDPRYPQTRWVNLDNGQALRTGLKPKAKKGSPVGLADTTSIVDQIKAQTAAQPSTAPSTDPVTAAPAYQPAPATVPAPAPALPGGIRLPGVG